MVSAGEALGAAIHEGVLEKKVRSCVLLLLYMLC